MTIRGSELGIASGAALLAAMGVSKAQALQVDLLELDERRNAVTLAILGTPDFDPRNVDTRGLLFGWTRQGDDGGYVEVWKAPRKLRDVDGDGILDRLISFHLSDTDFRTLREGGVAEIEVRGIYRDGPFLREFAARNIVRLGPDALAVGGAPPCTPIQDADQNIIGERCYWAYGAGPVDTADLVTSINALLAVGTDLRVESDSAVVIEAYGAYGQRGEGTGSDCHAKGGDAGGPGYARTILTVSDLPSQLYLYPWEYTNTHSSGGASTVVSSVALARLTETALASTTAAAAVSAGVLAIAGGGGGGGKGHKESGDCYHGGDGGSAGAAISGTSDHATAVGFHGTRGSPGQGGQISSGGAGDPHGSSGIGGPGGLGPDDVTSPTSGTGGNTLWVGWSDGLNPIYLPDNWEYGAGGYNNTEGGSGGGGFSGGGAANGAASAHRGGGGGSLAMRSTVDAADIAADLIRGQSNSSTAYNGSITLTFQLDQIFSGD